MKKSKQIKKNSYMHMCFSRRLAFAVKWLFVIIMCTFTLYPVVYTILGSFKTNAELTKGGSLLPTVWHFENFYNAFVGANFVRYTGNSVIISISVMLLAIISTSMAGFILARRSFPLKKLWITLYTSMMFISVGSVSLYPIYQLLHDLNLNKSIFGLVLILTGGQAANVFLVMGFTKAIPKELDEAAVIDGCSIYGVYAKMILPLTKPILSVVALFSFRNAWNDYITTLIMTISMPKLQTLTVAVVQLKYAANAAAEWHIMLAGSAIAIVPVLLVYLLAHKQFIGGLTAGSVKG